MKLSVVVPVYGVEKYIARCAKSLLEQTYADKEIVFVDDASPDRSVEILKQVLDDYPHVQTRILSHAVNLGLAATRKTGLDAATGEYIVSVDSDDYLELNALELLAQKARETKAEVIALDCWFEWNNRRKVYCGDFSANTYEYSRILLSGAALPNMWRHMIRRDLYIRTGLYPIEGLNNGEDYVLTPRLCWFAQSVAKMETPLYHYYQMNNGSITHNVSESGIRQLTQALEQLSVFYADKPDCARALQAGQWLKKVDMFMRADKQAYALVDHMPGSLPPVVDTMTLFQRIAAHMAARKIWNLLWIYSRCYAGLLETIQILKGRRRGC